MAALTAALRQVGRTSHSPPVSSRASSPRRVPTRRGSY